MTAARVAVAATFCALLVHTIGYADYLTDPLTWALLAVGVALSPAVRPPHQAGPLAAADASRGAAHRSEVERPGGP